MPLQYFYLPNKMPAFHKNRRWLRFCQLSGFSVKVFTFIHIFTYRLLFILNITITCIWCVGLMPSVTSALIFSAWNCNASRQIRLNSGESSMIWSAMQYIRLASGFSSSSLGKYNAGPCFSWMVHSGYWPRDFGQLGRNNILILFRCNNIYSPGG